MDALWDAGDWLTPRQVHTVVGRTRELAYNTVLTVLVRLWGKGRLERHRDGRAHGYRALQSREQYLTGRMEQVLSEARDRPAALANFVESLDSKDRTDLRRLLGRARRRR